MKGKRKEKKKGFTLIELLAVIVILAIIALIATPMILGVIEKSRKSAFQDSVYSIFEAVDYYKIENEIGSLPREGISVQELNLKNKDQFISGVLKENEKEIRIENISNGIYCGNGTINDLKVKKGKCIMEYVYTGMPQTFIVPETGIYQVELWGAQGGRNDSSLGGYVSGKIELHQGEMYYIYVGERNKEVSTSSSTSPFNPKDVESFNGGGGSMDGWAGGGATDIRLVSGLWKEFDSLKSRIIIAGGGGSSYNNHLGYGGGLEGGTARLNSEIGGSGGTQTTPGLSNNCAIAAKFGIGGNCAGGGGGYYGGGGSAHRLGGGGGGSSFISGYVGCNAIDITSTENNIIHTNQPNHYSGKIFTDAVIKSGNEKMPTRDGKSTMVGNSGNGYAKITLLSVL